MAGHQRRAWHPLLVAMRGAAARMTLAKQAVVKP